MMLNSAVKREILATLASPSWVVYLDKKKAKLSEIIKMGEVQLTGEGVLIRHRNVQPEGGRREKKHRLWHHIYMFPENIVLDHMVWFVYGDS